MNVLEFSALLFGTSLLAGFLGALTGLGGGVVIVPVLALFFNVDTRHAAACITSGADEESIGSS